MADDRQIESYMSAVCASLSAAGDSRCQAIAGEIVAHIASTAAETGRSAEDVLADLGPAEKLAARYRRVIEIERAERSYSPIALLSASLKAGLPGVLTFVIAMLGYWAAGAMLVFGLLGLVWTAVSLAAHAASAMRSPVGNMLAMIGTGCVVLAATTLMLRAALRTVRRQKLPLAR